MTKDPLLYLVDILYCCELLTEYTKNVEQYAFKLDIRLQDAVFRRIEIIGEASKNVPNYLQEKYSNVPWKKMIGMRNVLIHQYDGVDLTETWYTVKKEVPKIRPLIQKIIAELKKE